MLSRYTKQHLYSKLESTLCINGSRGVAKTKQHMNELKQAIVGEKSTVLFGILIETDLLAS